MTSLVLFPGALGDFLCFLPTGLALRRAYGGNLCVVAQPACLDLVRRPDITGVSIDRREIADLFSTRARITDATARLFGGFARTYSWTGFGNAEFSRRLAAATGGPVDVYPFRGMRAGEHAVDYYARCVGLRPAPVEASLITQDAEWFAGFAARHRLRAGGFLLIHPGSGGRAKNWEGFADVARQWRMQRREPVVVLLGPAEAERPALSFDDAIVVDGLTLPQVAALLRSCGLYLGNDSGISHLAGAVGASGVVLFGQSDPAVWAPRSDRLRVVSAPQRCTACGAERFCTHRLSVETVTAELATVLGVPAVP